VFDQELACRSPPVEIKWAMRQTYPLDRRLRADLEEIRADIRLVEAELARLKELKLALQLQPTRSRAELETAMEAVNLTRWTGSPR